MDNKSLDPVVEATVGVQTPISRRSSGKPLERHFARCKCRRASAAPFFGVQSDAEWVWLSERLLGQLNAKTATLEGYDRVALTGNDRSREERWKWQH